MKKTYLIACSLLLSAVLLSACGEKVEDGGSHDVNIEESGAGQDGNRGRIEDDREDEGEDTPEISGSIVPAVSGSISPVEGEEGEVEVQSTPSSNEAKGRELMAIVSSAEEAREIAELYGIELVEEQYGIAVFHTDEDPSSVVQRGIDNGWPAIGINHTSDLIE